MTVCKFYYTMMWHWCVYLQWVVCLCAELQIQNHSSPVRLKAVWLGLSSEKYLCHADLMWLQMTVFSSPLLIHSLPPLASLPHVSSQAVVPQCFCVTEGCGVTNLGRCFKVCKLRGRETVGLVSAGFMSFFFSLLRNKFGHILSMQYI